MQPQVAITLGLSKGTSIITESIFENRFRYVEEMRRMGANIKVVDGNTAIINGVEKYTGATVVTPDLRAGAALLIAACCAKGTTEIEDIYHIERGYENIAEKFIGLGADIRKVSTSEHEKTPLMANVL